VKLRKHGIESVVAALVFSNALLFAAGAEPRKADMGSLFRPANFQSLGKLVVASGETVIFDTGSAETPPSLSGVLKGTGGVGVSQSGKVQLAVFSFDAITIATGAKVEVKGDRGLMLLSKEAVSIDAKFDLSGGNGTAGRGNPVGAGGPGGEGGEYRKTFASNPPAADGGDGGPAMKDNGKPGRGYGAGFNRRAKGGVAGGGGGYGGAGGDTSEGSPVLGGKIAPMPGGVTYGSEKLDDLFGGSGGAGASNDRGGDNGSGGGGGGAIGIISLKAIVLGPKGQISVNGGNGGKDKIGGGGGSGGAILLAAPTVTLNKDSSLDASGGAGASGDENVELEIREGRGRRNSGSGGGGGGGRIAIYAMADIGAPGKDQVEKKLPAGVLINGGKGGHMAKDGQAGTLYDGKWPGLGQP